MWRILRLHLKHFVHIYAGMGKRDIEIDLSNCDKKVNLFIGKMGSGKSSILGHMQPFATYGTLDVRNQEDLILPMEDGLKEIDYEHNGHIINIQHKYTWSAASKSHSTKSYIQLDGTELNENGNARSFKEVIKTHFGIDQNFLRILRLGPNVANLINMKSTERKAFIASLLKDTEVYTLLYKSLSEEYRSMNSAMSVLSNKLISLQADKAPAMTAELDELKDDLEALNAKAEGYREKIAKLQGINQTLFNNQSFQDFSANHYHLDSMIKQMMARLDEISEIFKSMPEEDINQINYKLGEISFKLNSLNEANLQIQEELKKNRTERNRLRDQILLVQSDTQLQDLQDKVASIEKAYMRASRELQGFSSPYSSAYLNNLVTMIEQFQVSVDEMCANSREVINKVYYSDGSLTGWANHQLNILTGRRVNLDKLLHNVEFAKEYTSPIPLKTLPGCPGHACPFIQTHPVFIAAQSPDKRNKKVVDLQNQLNALDIEIAMCQDCVTQAPKMEYIKKTWSQLSKTLMDIGALREQSLFKILSNLNARCNWYDHGVLVAYTEKVVIQESYKQLETQYYTAKAEMAALQSSEVEVKKARLKDLDSEYEDILRRLQENRDHVDECIAEREKLTDLLSKLQNQAVLKEEERSLTQDCKVNKLAYQESADKIEQVNANMERISVLTLELDKVVREYESKSKRYSELQLRLQDIKTASADYESYSLEKGLLKLIVDAVSSKEGIPLVMVKLFLDQCKDIINDLISDIFDDDLEIVEFDIKDDSNEFKIPYRINGSFVPDIELASQGQQAVISIALSFALCRKSMFDYNIMLLDEIDNSIYKADRERFLMILIKQMRALNTDQVFLITHNDIFQQSNLPVNIIMTTPEVVDFYPNQSVMQI